MAVLHHWVNVDITEGQPPVQEVPVEHHHAADPQRDDPAGGAQHIGGVEGIEQAFGFRECRGIGPAHGAHRPKGRREPCVQHVGVLGEASGFELLFKIIAVAIDTGEDADDSLDRVGAEADAEVIVLRIAHGQVASSGWRGERRLRQAIREGAFQRPHRNAMAPPELPADAPVAEILVPVLVRAGVAGGRKGDDAIACLLAGQPLGRFAVHLGWRQRAERLASQSIIGDTHIPLVAEPRLNGNM